MPSISALEFLDADARRDVPGICAAYGDEMYLKRLAIDALRESVASDDGEFSASTLAGATAELRDVLDAVSTMSLFGGGRRLVVVEQADEFVTRNRAALEQYVAKPRSSGVLVLDVKTWPSNTRLAKAVAEHGLSIDCAVPAKPAIVKWLVARAGRTHRSKIDRAAADLLVETIGPELGQLDQELAKLAAAAGDDKITEDLVERFVAGWRAKTTWDMLDAALAGDTRTALAELEQLLWAGENAIGLLAQIGASLRRFAAATRIIEHGESTGHGVPLRRALEAAGVKTAPFIMNKAESQLRRLGRRRGARLYRLLLEADLALKGASSSPKRTRIVLERLIVELAVQAPAALATSPSRTAGAARK